jgi:hypothetical protein
MHWLSRNFWYLFLIPGLLMLAAGLVIGFRAASFELSSTRAQGTVIGNQYRATGEHGGSYYPEVQFATPDGRLHKFVGSTGRSPAAFEEGASVPVLYQEEVPERATIATFFQQYSTSLAASMFGLVLTLAGGSPLVSRWRRERLVQWLERNGQSIQANITGSRRVSESPSAPRSRNPYHISAQWTDPATNRVHSFESADVWYDPAPYLKSKTVAVLMDPANPERYSMDTAFLPPLVR